MTFHKNTVHFKAVLCIRIRIGWIRIQEGKKYPHKKKEKREFLVLKYSMFFLRAEAFSYNLNVLYRGLDIYKILRTVVSYVSYYCEADPDISQIYRVQYLCVYGM
jgi:hypothetical protein